VGLAAVSLVCACWVRGRHRRRRQSDPPDPPQNSGVSRWWTCRRTSSLGRQIAELLGHDRRWIVAVDRRRVRARVHGYDGVSGEAPADCAQLADGESLRACRQAGYSGLYVPRIGPLRIQLPRRNLSLGGFWPWLAKSHTFYTAKTPVMKYTNAS